MRGTDRLMDALHVVYEAPDPLGVLGAPLSVPLPVFARALGAPALAHSPRRAPGGCGTLTPRAVVLWIGVASLAGALALVPLVGSEFIPQTDQGFTQLNVRLPVGSSLERSDAKIRQVEELVRRCPRWPTISTNVGGVGAGLSQGRNQATLNIGLKPRAQRQRSQKAVEDAIRARLAKVPGIDVSLGFDRPIYVAVLGNDPDGLATITQDLAKRIRAIRGIVDVEVSVKPGLPAYAVRLNPGAVRELGLTAPQLASSLRAYVNGEIATYWTTSDGQQVEVQLRLPATQRERIDQLRHLPVAFSKDGAPILLDTVATIVPVVNPEVIRRQNLQRREAIFAGVEGRPAGDAGKDVQELVDGIKLPPGFSFDVGGQTKEQQDAFAAMLAALGLSVIFIYIVLASQFGSFLQPLAIMASLPLSLIGVMLALLLWRSTLNVFSMIGLIMLMGLVTKNAILLVDFANQGRKAGLNIPDALLQAGLVRMRPIIMTTSAMVFGMLPLALALNEGGEIQAPMGRAIIGGIITSTLLTLVVVPVLYSYLVRERREVGAVALPSAGPMGQHMPAAKE